MIKKNILIRMIEKEDMDAVINILQSISEFMPPKRDYNNIWKQLCNQTNVYSLVAIMNEEIVGYGSIIFEIKIRGGKMAHVEDIAVHQSYRKKGIGKAVVDALFDFAKKNGCYKIALHCNQHNVLFYKKCNYEISGTAMQRIIKPIPLI